MRASRTHHQLPVYAGAIRVHQQRVVTGFVRARQQQHGRRGDAVPSPVRTRAGGQHADSVAQDFHADIQPGHDPHRSAREYHRADRTKQGFVPLTGGTVYTSLNSGDWSTAANWTPTGVPIAGDQAIINANHVIDLKGTSQAVATLTFNQNGSLVSTTGAGTLTMGSVTSLALIQALYAYANPTLSADVSIVLGANLQVDQSNFGTLTITGPTSGPNSLTKTGIGELLLNSPDSTYSAGTILRSFLIASRICRAVNSRSARTQRPPAAQSRKGPYRHRNADLGGTAGGDRAARDRVAGDWNRFAASDRQPDDHRGDRQLPDFDRRHEGHHVYGQSDAGTIDGHHDQQHPNVVHHARRDQRRIRGDQDRPRHAGPRRSQYVYRRSHAGQHIHGRRRLWHDRTHERFDRKTTCPRTVRWEPARSRFCSMNRAAP